MADFANDERSDIPSTEGEPDVVLDIPDASIDKVEMEVDDLDAHLSLNAKVANFLRLDAGVDAYLDDVTLTIEDVGAEAHLRVHLDQVQSIVKRALDAVDNSIDEMEPVLKEVSKPKSQRAADRVKNLLPGTD